MAITSGYLATSNCSKAVGGVIELYGVDTAAISSVTTSGNEMTNIVFGSSGVGFEKFIGTKGSVTFVEDMQRNENGGDINNITITFNTPALSAADLAILDTVRKECKMHWVVRCPDGIFYYVGYDVDLGDEAYVEFSSMNHNTGAAKTDSHVYTWTLMAEQVNPCFILTGISGASGGAATTAAAIAAELVAATSV